ncbi:MAG: class F sortase, partial [Candidatus Dormibacteraeota bacterium]|nr:class F sortase [Candidatus Dormibacteraeota bacterium]
LQLVISKINVNAPVEVVGLDENNNMGVPEKPTDVGLYGPGAQPGQPGDAVIDGHLDWYNMPQAVFYNLSNLAPGDEVDVLEGSKTLHFKVTDSENVAYNSHPPGLFATDGAPRLTLITCSGSWDVGRSTYTQRLIVNAEYTGTT